MYLLGLSQLLLTAGLLGQQALAHSDSHGHLHAQLRDLRKRGLLSSLNEPVSITGDHAFQPPREGDQRGPCPGLNALANHGYIPRHGVVSLLEATTAITDVYNMSIELAVLLSVMGTVWTGNPVSLSPSFSIGGTDNQVQNLLGNLLGLLGHPRGLDHSHNLIEADSSPTRNDLYVTGDPVTMNLSSFEILYDMIPDGGYETSTIDLMADFASIRWNQTISTNPYFYYGPVTGMIARNTGYCIIGNLFANYSAEHPRGILTHDALKSFYAVSGVRSNFTYQKGHERIPENWYKTTSPYGLVNLNLDIVQFVLRYPIFGSIGGNIGKVNSFTGVNLIDPVDGLAGVPRLLEGNNLVCFVLEVVNFAAPNYLNNLVSTLAGPLELILDAVAGPLLNMSCPQLGEITRDGVPLWESLGAEFPGANRSGSAM